MAEGVEEALADPSQSAWLEKGGQAPGLLPEAPISLASCRPWIEPVAGECLGACGPGKCYNQETLPRGQQADRGGVALHSSIRSTSPISPLPAGPPLPCTHSLALPAYSAFIEILPLLRARYSSLTPMSAP